MNIKLTDQQYKRFIDYCNRPPRPLSDKIKQAAKSLDSEGLKFKVKKCTH